MLYAVSIDTTPAVLVGNLWEICQFKPLSFSKMANSFFAFQQLSSIELRRTLSAFFLSGSCWFDEQFRGGFEYFICLRRETVRVTGGWC